MVGVAIPFLGSGRANLAAVLGLGVGASAGHLASCATGVFYTVVLATAPAAPLADFAVFRAKVGVARLSLILRAGQATISWSPDGWTRLAAESGLAKIAGTSLLGGSIA
jgi:hypothetical protein